MRFTCLALCFLIACDSDDSTPPADAAAPKDSSTQDDAPAGNDAAAACTGLPYDPCTDNAQCMSNNCHLFQGAGLQVCTQACTPGSNECPMQNGQAVPCNNMSACRPNAANACTR